MADGRNKNESGYALLYALGAIVLINLIVGAIFILARTVFLQVEKVDSFKQIKDVEEYALQEASNKIKKTLEQHLADLGAGVNFGSDEVVLKNLVNSWIADFEISKEDIGSNQQFSYTLSFKNSQLKTAEVLPYELDTATGSYGWKKAATTISDVTNVALTFPISAEVTEIKDGKETKVTATCEYVYEIQWNQVDVDEEIVALDVWRNVFYSYYLPNNAQIISADEWLRKFDRIYRYQSDAELFDYTSYDNASTYRYGEMNGQVVDIFDGTFLDFSNGTKTIRDISFSGSFFLENGVAMKGSNRAKVETDNLLVLSNSLGTSDPLLNYVQLDQVTTKIGTYIDMPLEQSRLILDINQLHAGNLLINNTNTKKKAATSSEGVLLAKGNVTIDKVAGAEDFSFANYATESTKKNPKDRLWNEFLNGSLVIASSNLYAGPVTENVSLHSDLDDSRKITVSGNFMLTNAMLSSTEGEEGMSYFQDQAGFTYPNTPSKLTLEGSATKLTVSGKSFIDSPKTERRQALTEVGGTAAYTGFYKDKEYWNSITLKNSASMELSYTGIEPFNLAIQKGSYLSLKTLPDLALFDQSFIEYSASRNQLNGKLIIQPFNQKDADTLKSKLQSSNIPVEVVTTDLAGAIAADDGQVVIVMPVNTSDKSSTQMISRTFEYVKSVDY